MMRLFEHDLLLAFRLLRRRAGFSALVVIVLGVGIGATTAIFTLVDSVLVRPLPYAAPDRLVTIWQTRPDWRSEPMLSRQWDRVALSWEDFLALRQQATAFSDVEIVYQGSTQQLGGAGEAAEVEVARASAGLLGMLGVHTEAGRWFTSEEQGAGAPAVAVISDALWTTRFGSDTSLSGRSLDLDGRRFSVVGVLPRHFYFGAVGPFATPGVVPDVWTPVGVASRDTVHHSYNYEAVGRLALGFGTPEAQAQVDRILRNGRDETHFGVRVLLRSDAEDLTIHRPLLLLFSAVALILFVACANAALLLLGAGAWRVREMAVRRALGATQFMLARQLMLEHLVLGLGGGVLGIGLAQAALRVASATLALPLPRPVTPEIDPRALGFAATVAVLSAVLSGLGPLLALARTADDPLRSRIAGHGSIRAQRVALAVQTVLAMVLLSTSEMLTVSLLREASVAPGFATTRRLVVGLDLPGFRYPTPASQVQFVRSLQARFIALPGVSAVAATSSVPLADRGSTWSVNRDVSVRLSSASPTAQHDEVTPEWFHTMGIPLRAGRAFEATDEEGAPLVAVVNETMARTLWPGRSPIGAQFLAPNGGVRTVIGVVADLHHQGLREAAAPTFYQSLWQQPTEHVSFVLVASTVPSVLTAAARQIVTETDPQVPLGRMETLDQIVTNSLTEQRFRAGLATSFAVIATILVATGIGGVTAGGVRRRMRELCVRLAVGGSAPRVRAEVARQELRVVVTSVLVGVAGAVGAGRLIVAYLFGANLTGAIGIAGAGVFLLLIALAASWIPTRALDRVDVSRWLRED